VWALLLAVLELVALPSCTSSSAATVPPPDGRAFDAGPRDAHAGRAIEHVFVVAMENADATSVYAGAGWPYASGVLLPQAARALAFQDELGSKLPSEPHYIWMEAGTNVFADHAFTTDDPPSMANSTGDPDHLVTQLAQSETGADWTSYQEGLDAATGACPITGDGFYRPRHNPFVFFRDVAGTPPSPTAPACAAHHRPLSALDGDLAADNVSGYAFITPNLCNSGHGQSGCPSSGAQQSADRWLEQALPPLIAFANAHDGVVFLVWDEGASSDLLPFIAVGPHVKAGYASPVTYSHSSLLKSVEEIFGVPILPAASAANDFSDLFEPGFFP
jgi:phosphatidylinositol-3-phosphatase